MLNLKEDQRIFPFLFGTDLCAEPGSCQFGKCLKPLRKIIGTLYIPVNCWDGFRQRRIDQWFHTTNVAIGYLSFHRFDVSERYDMRNHGSKANHLSHTHV